MCGLLTAPLLPDEARTAIMPLSIQAAMNSRAKPRGLADIMQVTADVYKSGDHPRRELGTE